MFQNYPNPFNPGTQIYYHLEQDNFVTISVYNILGQFMETLVDGWHMAGKYSVQWGASDYSSGIYLYQIRVGDFCQIRQCQLLK